jgi:transcription elongation factor
MYILDYFQISKLIDMIDISFIYLLHKIDNHVFEKPQLILEIGHDIERKLKYT